MLSPWGLKESDTTERQKDRTELIHTFISVIYHYLSEVVTISPHFIEDTEVSREHRNFLEVTQPERLRTGL